MHPNIVSEYTMNPFLQRGILKEVCWIKCVECNQIYSDHNIDKHVFIIIKTIICISVWKKITYILVSFLGLQ